jgi:putative hydrolase of the HAD superfamily
MRVATRAVLLDLDDTITDRSATVRAYAQQFASDFGERFRLADISVIASELSRIDQNGYNHARASDLATHEAWTSSPGAAVLASHWDHHFVDCTQAREGLSSTVAALDQAALRLGVVTNGRTDKQRRKIEALNLQELLGALLISEEFGAAKPDERIFRAAAAKLGVHPHECMFVGDNPEKDVRGASTVGMRAVWFRAGLPWPKNLAPARESIASLEEVLELLGLH